MNCRNTARFWGGLGQSAWSITQNARRSGESGAVKVKRPSACGAANGRSGRSCIGLVMGDWVRLQVVVQNQRFVPSIAKNEFSLAIVKDGIICMNYGMMVRTNQNKIF